MVEASRQKKRPPGFSMRQRFCSIALKWASSRLKWRTALQRMRSTGGVGIGDVLDGLEAEDFRRGGWGGGLGCCSMAAGFWSEAKIS